MTFCGCGVANCGVVGVGAQELALGMGCVIDGSPDVATRSDHVGVGAPAAAG